MLSVVIAASFSSTVPTRELLFGSLPGGDEAAEGACVRFPCEKPEFACTEYPEESPSCRECINDPSIPYYPDDTPCSDIEAFKTTNSYGCTARTLYIKNPPECCVFGGPFADDDVHMTFLGGTTETTGLPYGIKTYFTDRHGHDQTYCYVHREVLEELGKKAGYHAAMVTTLFAFDPPATTWKGVGFNYFCDHPDNDVVIAGLTDVSVALEAKGAKWAYDCQPDGPFASIQAEMVDATAWIGMSPENGCAMAYEGEEPCTQVPMPLYDECQETSDPDKCDASRKAQWAAYLNKPR